MISPDHYIRPCVQRADQSLHCSPGIFIIEGVITCVIAVASYWLLVDFPDSKRKLWKFLDDNERAWIVKKINADRGDAVTPKFQLGKFLKAGLDWKIW